MLIGGLVFLLLLIGLLAIPISVTFHVNWPHKAGSEVALRYLFGLVRVRFNPFRPPTPSYKGKTRTRQHRRRKPAARKTGSGLAVFKQKPFRRRIMRFMREFWQAVHKQDVRLHVRIGLGDPAETGQLWAVLGPLAGFLANTPQASIAIEPDFLDSTLEVDGSGTIRMIPLQLLGLVFGLLLSPTLWQGLRQARKAAA